MRGEIRVFHGVWVRRNISNYRIIYIMENYILLLYYNHLGILYDDIYVFIKMRCVRRF